MQPRWLGARRGTWHGTSGPPRATSRETGPRTVVERALEGENPRRAPTGGPGLARFGVVAERTPGGSKASKRACRPLTGEPSVRGKGFGTCDALARRGDRTSDRAEPSSRLMSPRSTSGWVRGRRAGANNGESDREDLAGTAPAAVEREPARKKTARESGYGSPGRESSGGKLQGRERHERRPRRVGGHGERRGPKDLERAACWPEPSRGARTLRTAPTGVWRLPSPTSDRKEARGGEGHPT